MKEEYAIYLRKSRADIEAEAKGEGETLARHEHILLDLAKKKKLKIGKIYKEIVSGETIEARPEMAKLLSDVKCGKWEGVLVVEVERLARGETMDQGIVAKVFKVSNTKIITPLKVYDPNNEFDEEYFEFGLFMSRREYKTINRRLQRGREISVNEGKYVGSIPPFGYDRVKIPGDKGYTLKENLEANTVKIIYDLYAYEDLSLNEIAKRLNQIGLKPRKTEKWSVSTIKDILGNPVYIGKIKWNARKEIKTYKDGKLIKTRPRNKDYILVDGLHKGIIDNKTWQIVLEKRKLNLAPVKQNNTVQNPLCGLVRCEKCGKKMKRKAYSKYGNEPILYCDNPKCDNVSTKLSYVEEKILDGLTKWLEQYKFNYKEYIEKLTYNKIQSIEETESLLESKLKKENDKLNKIFNFLEDGTYTKEIFEERKKSVLRNITEIKKSIRECKIKLLEEKNQGGKEETVLASIGNITDIYKLLQTPEEKNILLKLLLNQVTFLKKEKAIKKGADPTNFTIILYPKINKYQEKSKV